MATSLKIDSYSIDVNELQQDINQKPRYGGNDKILIDEGLQTPMIHSGGNSLSPKKNKVIIVKKKIAKDDGTMTVIDENIYNSIDLGQINENEQFQTIKNSRNVDQMNKTDEAATLPAIGNSGRNKMKNAIEDIKQMSPPPEKN